MSSVVSFKVPREVKEKMRKLSGRVNWSKELREFVIKRVLEEEKKISLEEAFRLIKETSSVPKGTAAKLVREDRDSG